MAPKPSSASDTAGLLSGEDDRNPCGCTKSSSIRRSCISLIQWWGFDSFILLVIVLNSIMMMSDSPLETDETTAKARLIAKLEIVFNTIFTLELVVKVTALGLTKYLGDLWNVLDLTVVTTAWAPYVLPTAGNYSWIRSVRVLRALRTINRLPELKKLVNTLFSPETLSGVRGL